MKKRILAAVIALMGLGNLAIAQDAPVDDSSKWQFRLRGIVVTPDESADIEAIGGDVDISTAVVPEFDISYFFDDTYIKRMHGYHSTQIKRAAAMPSELLDIDLLQAELDNELAYIDFREQQKNTNV